MSTSELGDVIDLTRYPIDQPDSEEGQALMARCRALLGERALCALPGFVHHAAATGMAREAEALAPDAFRYNRARIAYEYCDQDWPTGHPRTITHPCRYHQLLNYQIPNDSPVRDIYLYEPLREFLRRVLGYEALHRSACPHLALTIQIADPGDCNGWHFDGNDAVFSLLLQQPEAGGAFEYVPYIRSATEENYAAVAATIADPESHASRPEIGVGTFTLFKGDESLHRVTQVDAKSTKRRIIALFSFDRTANQIYQQQYIDELRGCTPLS